MTTVKEFLDAKPTGPAYGENGLLHDDRVKWINDRQPVLDSHFIAAYRTAGKTVASIESELYKTRMERDKLNEKVEELEDNLRAAEHTKDTLGNVQLP